MHSSAVTYAGFDIGKLQLDVSTSMYAPGVPPPLYATQPDDEACLEKAQDDPIALDIPELFQGLNNNERIWKEYERWAIENLDPSNVLVLSYEELLATPQQTMDKAYSFLGVPEFKIDLARAANRYDTTCLDVQIVNGPEIKQAMENMFVKLVPRGRLQ